MSGWTAVYDRQRYHTIYDEAHRAASRIALFVDLSGAEDAARKEWRFLLSGRRAAHLDAGLSEAVQRTALDLLAVALGTRRAVLDQRRATAALRDEMQAEA